MKKFNLPSKAIVAIIAIVFLETIALIKGVNGVALGSSFSIIGGIGGYYIAKRK